MGGGGVHLGAAGPPRSCALSTPGGAPHRPTPSLPCPAGGRRGTATAGGFVLGSEWGPTGRIFRCTKITKVAKTANESLWSAAQNRPRVIFRNSAARLYILRPCLFCGFFPPQRHPQRHQQHPEQWLRYLSNGRLLRRWEVGGLIFRLHLFLFLAWGLHAASKYHICPLYIKQALSFQM